jgi:hypothetical protein
VPTARPLPDSVMLTMGAADAEADADAGPCGRATRRGASADKDEDEATDDRTPPREEEEEEEKEEEDEAAEAASLFDFFLALSIVCQSAGSAGDSSNAENRASLMSPAEKPCLEQNSYACVSVKSERISRTKSICHREGWGGAGRLREKMRSVSAPS